MSCSCSGNSICPCEGFVHPAQIFNVAGLDHISYRIGDYMSFREALLRALPGEVSLTAGTSHCADGSMGSPGTTNVARLWRPGASGDLAVQMIEWWAYLADILTFYNERIATQAYLRTADQAITVNRLVRLLGYRPRPGIGATGTVAALMNGTTSFILSQGFQIQSKPAPGQQPQIFELSSDTTITAPDSTAVDPPSLTGITFGNDPNGNQSVSVLVTGVANVKKGDQLLLMEDTWSGASGNYAVGTVWNVEMAKGPDGNRYTSVSLTLNQNNFASTSELTASQYRLMRSQQFMRLYQNSSSPELAESASKMDLQTITRQINAGDFVLCEDQTTKTWQLVSVTSASDNIGYITNTTSDSPIPVFYTTLGFTPAASAGFGASTTILRYAWQDVGELMDQPATSVTVGQSSSSTADEWNSGSDDWTLNLTAAGQAAFPAESSSTPVLLQDAGGNGVSGTLPLSSPETSATLTVSSPDVPPATLTPPLRVLYNLLQVSRGKTVSNEILGNGNAAIAGQDFTLKKSPVTYQQDPGSLSGPLYSSTVKVSVNQIQWTEVQNFFGQKPNAQVFVTHEDEQGNTHVIFGDGVNGARLPTGINNIVATYRYGSGVIMPDVGSLTMILKPQPGLKAIVNPVPMTGGADPDPPDQVRQYAPQSVLTFGRAVSLDDFQAIAATTPGVTRAQASVVVNPESQQSEIQIYVLPGSAATNAQTALQPIADPACVFSVLPASAIPVFITATLIVDPKMNPDAVLANATNALAGQNSGLFILDPNSGTPGNYILDIGQAVYDSQIFDALQVPGVLAVTGYSFSCGSSASGPVTLCNLQRHDPRAGNYFALTLDGLDLVSSQPTASS